MHAHLWAVALLAAATGEPPAEPPLEPAIDDAVEPSAQADAELTRLREGLDALLAGEPAQGVTVAELLGGTVPTREELDDRLTAIESTLEGVRVVMETASEQELLDAGLRYSISTHQRDYLQRLALAYDKMPRPAASAFDLLTQSRTPLRAQAAALADLEVGATALLGRLQTLDNLLAAGRLVGFRADQTQARRRLDAVTAALSAQTERLAQLRASLQLLAGELESESRELHETVLRTIANNQGEAARDVLYRNHLREQRRLRQSLTHRGAGTDAITGQVETVEATLAEPTTLGDVFAAEASIADVQQRAQEMASLLDTLSAAPDRWALAFEREVTTLLEPLASAETRAQAQKITTEIVEEIRIEANDGWARVITWARAYPSEVREFVTDWRAHGGQLVAVLTLLVLAILFGTGRIAPMRWLVRRLARWPWLRKHVGLVVRGGNLLQTVFPSLAVFVLLYFALDVVGFDRPEVQLVWVFVHWIGLFWIGRQLVLGITRPVARGRPSLISASPATIDLVRITYARVGLIFAVAFLLDDIAAGWFGAGHLRALIDLVVIIWTGAWALWAALAWRERLGRAWSELATRESREQRFTEWMRHHRAGALFSLVALLRILLQRALIALWWLLERAGITTYLRAKSLRRLSLEDSGESHATPGKLPEEYLRGFPLSPLVDDNEALVRSRPGTADPILAHVASWQQSHAEGSEVLIGEKGSGKTTLLTHIAAKLDTEVTLHTWGPKATSEQQVVHELAPLFGRPDTRDLTALIDTANAGPDRIIFLDEVHNVFLRTIDGYRGFDTLVELVNATHEKIFWLLAFNSFAWEFLNQSRGRTHYFRRLTKLERWGIDELKDLIGERNKESGFTVEFDPVILDADAETRDFQLVESADGFFRLLWETSGGNPRVGLYLWLQSLQMQFGSIRAKLFRQPSLEQVNGLTDEMVFALASICQHDNLSVDDLALVLRMKPGHARFAMQFLREAGIVEPTHGRDSYTLAPRYYRQTLRYLRGRHLLFEAS